MAYFNTGKFDENVLKYLCAYFTGGIKEETKVWNAARGFEIECKDFEERIIAQMVLQKKYCQRHTKYFIIIMRMVTINVL